MYLYRAKQAVKTLFFEINPKKQIFILAFFAECKYILLCIIVK